MARKHFINGIMFIFFRDFGVMAGGQRVAGRQRTVLSSSGDLTQPVSYRKLTQWKSDPFSAYFFKQKNSNRPVLTILGVLTGGIITG